MIAPTSLIINPAFTEPQRYWAENTDRTLRVEEKRRPTGYEIIDRRENTRRQMAIPLVDDIHFSECISDDETVEEAIADGHDALKATVDDARQLRTALEDRRWRGVSDFSRMTTFRMFPIF